MGTTIWQLSHFELLQCEKCFKDVQIVQSVNPYVQLLVVTTGLLCLN